MRKLLLLLLIFCCLPVLAFAATELSVTPYEMGFDYEIDSTEQWFVLIWDSANEDGRKTLYSEDGHFSGSITLPYGAAGGKYTVTLQNLKQTKVVKKTVQIPQAADYVKPSGSAGAKVNDLTLTETPTGFRYAFTAPDTDYMMLYFRSKQEEATFPVYPVDASGRYEGEILSPLTYAPPRAPCGTRKPSARAMRHPRPPNARRAASPAWWCASIPVIRRTASLSRSPSAPACPVPPPARAAWHRAR